MLSFTRMGTLREAAPSMHSLTSTHASGSASLSTSSSSSSWICAAQRATGSRPLSQSLDTSLISMLGSYRHFSQASFAQSFSCNSPQGLPH